MAKYHIKRDGSPGELYNNQKFSINQMYTIVTKNHNK